MKKLLIIDSHSILYKNHFAFGRNPLINSKGKHVSALFGFLRSLLGVFDEIAPDALVFAFDKGRKTFRSQIYPEYKAHRSETPEELKEQLNIAPKLAEALGAKVLMYDEFEADDILGSVAKQLTKNQNIHAYLLTGDRDSYQLCDSCITIAYASSKSEKQFDLITPDKIAKTYDGLAPADLITVKALMGDQSDNIPGVGGVGEKTAIKLVKEYATLENLYENLEQIPGKLKEKLANDKEKAFLSRTLAKIKTDILPEPDFEDLKWDFTPSKELHTLLSELELPSLIRQIFTKLPEQAQIQTVSHPVKTLEKPDFRLILTNDQLDEVFSNLKNQTRIAFDIETTPDPFWKANLVGISFACEKMDGVYIPVGHRYLGAPLQVTTEALVEALISLFAHKNIEFCAHNAKFDLGVLCDMGIPWPQKLQDSMILAHLLYPEERMGLKSLSARFLGSNRPDYEEIAGKNGNFSSVNLEKALDYAAADAYETLKLTELFLLEIKKQENLFSLYENMEIPLIRVLAKMEKDGILIDKNEFFRMEKEISSEILSLGEKITTMAGVEFNLNSTKQLAEILFVKMQIPAVKKTKTGFSTATEVLEELAPRYPICSLLTEYRHFAKLLSTYITPLPQICDSNHLIHTSFNQTIVATGRLSSNHPNLQNIPVRGEWGKKIRRGFVPKPDCILASIDYSQVELRVLAHFCKDENLIRAFHEKRDIHRETAARVFEIPLEEVDYTQRDFAKAINFGLIYGISAYGLSKQLSISMPQAKKFIDSYFRAYPNVKIFMEETAKSALDCGFVVTMFGRVRRIQELKSSNKNNQEAGKRVAINTIIQGSAAEIIKKAMLKIQNYLEKNFLKSKILLQVHDELLFNVTQDEISHLPVIKEIMETVTPLAVPLVCDLETGKNWGRLENFTSY